MDQFERNYELAREFIASKGGNLPEYQYNIKVPGVGHLAILPEDESIEKYWVMSTEIYRHCGWHSPGCLLGAINELPSEEFDLLPVFLDGGIARIHVVNQDGIMPLLINNVAHFDLGLSMLAVSWPYIFAQKENGYSRIPDPLRTALNFWDIVDVDDNTRAIQIETLVKSFGIDEEDIRALVETRMDKVWDEDRELWVYRRR